MDQLTGDKEKSKGYGIFHANTRLVFEKKPVSSGVSISKRQVSCLAQSVCARVCVHTTVCNVHLMGVSRVLSFN